MGNESFAELAKRKLIENLLSVKVWIIFSLMGITFYLVSKGLMAGDVFAAVNGGVISTVLAIREGIKVAKIQAGNSENVKKTLT